MSTNGSSRNLRARLARLEPPLVVHDGAAERVREIEKALAGIQRNGLPSREEVRKVAREFWEAQQAKKGNFDD